MVSTCHIRSASFNSRPKQDCIARPCAPEIAMSAPVESVQTSVREIMGNSSQISVRHVLVGHVRTTSLTCVTPPSLGTDWPMEMLPASKYNYSIGVRGEKSPLNEAEEEIQALAKWLYASNVLKTADHRVVVREELCYVVTTDVLYSNPWEARIQCFDIRNQENIVVCFTLAN